MKIVKPYAKIIPTAWDRPPLLIIESAARISHRSEDLMKEDSSERFVRDVIVRRGDWSVTEHVSVTVEFLVDRGITHELVRHRLFSYTQESTRFVNYEKKMPPSFIYPDPELLCGLCMKGVEVHKDEKGYWWHGEKEEDCHFLDDWMTAIDNAEQAYKNLVVEWGWRPQEARSVFPNALASKLWMTGNLRNWRHFFLMRTTKEAHPQMRQVTIPLLAEFKKLIPVLYEDIEPEVSQLENVKKSR